jgi:hypothetical protein
MQRGPTIAVHGLQIRPMVNLTVRYYRVARVSFYVRAHAWLQWTQQLSYDTRDDGEDGPEASLHAAAEEGKTDVVGPGWTHGEWLHARPPHVRVD